MPLKLDHVTPGGRSEFAVLESRETVLGREPGPSGLTIDNTAISRAHGLVACFDGHWFYRDLGSTNGSWVNSKAVPGGSWRILRPGTSLQLADSVFVVSAIGPESRGVTEGSSLFVFKQERYVSEFPVPEYGKALVVGGPQADVEIEGELIDEAAMTIERRGMSVCLLLSSSADLPVFYNGEQAVQHQTLQDGDELTVANYLILFNDPPRMQAGMGERGGRAAAWAGEGGARRAEENDGYEAPAAKTIPPAHSVFGRPQAADEELGADETVALDPEEAASKLGYDRHPSMRFTMDDVQKNNMAALEDRLIIVILGILLLALMGCMIWFIFL